MKKCNILNILFEAIGFAFESICYSLVSILYALPLIMIITGFGSIWFLFSKPFNWLTLSFLLLIPMGIVWLMYDVSNKIMKYRKEKQ